MALLNWDAWQWLALLQHELLLFAGIFFLIGAADDVAVDLTWLWLRLTGRATPREVDRAAYQSRQLAGRAAILIPAWHEAEVIGDTIAHALASWPQENYTLYIGCYRNDPATIAAVMRAAPGDRRLRIVIHDRAGPSTKADCLNRLYVALCEDETRREERYRMVVFHDAEDLVDPAALGLLDEAIGAADFVQLPVEPLVQSDSRWIGSHYCEEFAEAHGKGMVVRDALGAALPAAGVGCAVSRNAIDLLRRRHADRLPFSADSLTEDYELGLGVAEAGGTCRFVRALSEDGRVVATRAYFPARLDHVVRQKTRWVHGIALQGWDRVGWSGGPIETWMRARDRRGPLTALVLLMGYTLLALATLSWAGVAFGLAEPMPLSWGLKVLLAANFAAFLWRATWRFGFAARTYGFAEGIRAILRIPLTNVIAIMAGRRAIVAYAGTLFGKGRVVWDKTPHVAHPTRFEAMRAVRS